MTISDAIRYVGVNDTDIDLFESQYPVPNGVSYNSYLLLDDKIALLDTVDKAVGERFFENLEFALAGRPLDYVVVNHMEPDHSSSIRALRLLYPDIRIVGNAKTLQMIQGFYGIDTDTREQLIAANMTLEEMNDWIGSDSLAFISLDGLRASLADAGHDGFCTACFTGDYPVPIPDDVAKKSFLTRKDFEAVYAGEVS